MVQAPNGKFRRVIRRRGALAAALAILFTTTGCATMGVTDAYVPSRNAHRTDLKVAHAPQDLTRTIQSTSVRYELQGTSVELPLLESATHSRKRLSELSAIESRPLFRVRDSEANQPEPTPLPSFTLASELAPWQRARGVFGSLAQTALFEDSINGEIPSSPIQACRLQSCEPNFFWCLGTGIADEERGARWTSAAIFPLDEADTELPSLQIYGTTTRESDYLQVMPGFFWKPTREFYLTVGVPVGMSDEAPDWGVLVALAR